MAFPLPLPDELIGLTFNRLDVPSLLRCMQVCKLFHSIISGNTQLIYKIELFASYMEDNERASMDTVSRLNLLRQYNRVWNNMEWTSSGSIPMSNGHCWEFTSGILAQSTVENVLSLAQLPCELKGIPERRWSVPFDFRFRDFTLDSSQNLIVLLELLENVHDVSSKIYLRTLSGECHPDAAVKHITHTSANLHADYTFLMQICGKHIAVLFCDQSGDGSSNSFVVWDWRTGDRKVQIDASEFQSYAFMTEDLILAGILRLHAPPSLQVLRVAAFVRSTYSLEDTPYICELQYPNVRGTTDTFMIRSEPTPTWTPPTGLGVPFYGSRKDFIFTISMRVLWSGMQENTVLFVPLSTLLSEVERSHDMLRRNVLWDAWGPDGARMVCREPSEVWVCYTYGMKFIQGLPWHNGHKARVYDFNPYAARRHVKTSVDSPIPWKRLAQRPESSGQIQSFMGKVVTKLPGRVTNVMLEHSDEGWDCCMIGEDHIVMVQPRTSTYGYMGM